MRWIENLTGSYASSACVVDGALIISLPDAINPVVWRMDLGPAKSSALEIRKDGENLYTLTLKTPRGETHDIAPFDRRGKALAALMAVSRAVEKSHGQVPRTPVAAIPAQAAPANDPTPKKGGAGKWVMGLIGIVLLIALTGMYMNMGTRVMPSSAGLNGSIAPASGTAAPDAAGVPLSADEFLRNR